MRVVPLDKKTAAALVVERHYLHRRPSIRWAFGLVVAGETVGVITFGTPPSRHLQKSVCPSDPSCVVELNRLWVADSQPRNTETYFVARALRMIPPALVCSYADTRYGHVGYIYRAGNWHYAGITDQERKTPRYDYVVMGKHTREAFRPGADGTSPMERGEVHRVRRKPKHKYWLATGNRRERRVLEKLCGWAKMEWKARKSAKAKRGVAA